MAISGRLETLGVADVLEFLSFNRKSGKLTLSRREDQAILVLREGRILYAAAGGVRDTLGNILVRSQLIDEPTLLEALDRQVRAPHETRLGTVLVEMGSVSPEDLEAVVREQAEAVIPSLLEWKTGFFRFEPIDLELHGEIIAAQLKAVLHVLGPDNRRLFHHSSRSERGGAFRRTEGWKRSVRPH